MNFFFDLLWIGQPPLDALIGHYEPWLVLLSIVICAIACMVGYEMTTVGQMRKKTRARYWWRLAAAATFGLGIWSTHFIAMLAFDLGMDMPFDPLLSIISVVSAGVIAYMGLALIDRRLTSLGKSFAIGLIFVVATLAMHFFGMYAMNMPVKLMFRVEWLLFAASIGVPAACVSSWLVLRLAPLQGRLQTLVRTAGALMLALSVCGLHFGAMEGTIVMPLNGICSDFTTDHDNSTLIIGVSVAVLMLMLFAAVASMVNNRYSQSLQQKLSEQYQSLIKANRELEHARRAAESAAKVKGEFLSTMSHEIRTPLNIILGNCELLSSAQVTPQERGCLIEIKRAAETLFGIHNPIFDFIQLEEGRLPLHPAAFDARRLIDELSDYLALRADARGLEAKDIRIGQLPAKLVGDVGRIRQIMHALIDNALKFTSHGGITLVSETLPRKDGGCDLVFSVEDTGCGIDMEHIDMLFETFRQRNGSDTRAQGGIGMGLTLSRLLAKAMGGQLLVQGQSGIGSRFTLHLPLTVAVEEEKPAEAAPVIDKASRRLLVVDDHSGNLRLLVMLLKKLGYENIDTASNGREAVMQAAKQHYDAILMDCQMPEMDGFDATREIRTIEAANDGEKTVIIAVTADTMRSTPEKCLSAGMNDYLNKPINKQTMEACLTRWHINQNLEKPTG